MTDFRVGVSTVLVSVAMLMFEIQQTMVLSLQTLERNAFLVVSLCLLGLGSGGSIVTCLGRYPALSIVPVMAWSAMLFGLTMVISTIGSTWTASLPLLIVLGVLPYVFVGVFLGLLFKGWSARAHWFYFLNLTGSGIGCVGLIWILNGTGDLGLTTFLIAALAIVSGVVLSSNRRGALFVALLVLLVLAMPLRHHLFGLVPAPEKGMARLVGDPRIETEMVWSRWGYLGRLDLVRPGDGIENFRDEGVHIRRLLDQGADVVYFFAAGGNWTKAINFNDNQSLLTGFVRNSRNSLPYILTDPDEVLNIGFGAGVDIFLALQHDARDVVGVDINPLMIEAGKQLDGYFEDFYDDPRVAIVNMDGRSYVRNTRRQFDVISLTAVDTGELLHSNAHVLLENYLYTQEAFDEYFGALKDDGVIYVARPHRQLMRVVVTAIDTLRRSGVPHPGDHFAILGGFGTTVHWQSLVMSRRPLSEEQRDTIQSRYGERVFYLPGAQNNAPVFARLFEAVERGTEKTFIAELSEDVSPISDNRPFFYEFSMNWQQSPALRLLLKILWWVGGIAMVLIILPLCIVRLDKAGLTGRLWGAIGYFVAIGFGFMFVEIGLIQSLVLFLGHPSYSITVTLFSILIFSGLGSLFAGRLSPERHATAWYIWMPIVAAVVFYALALGTVLLQLQVEELWLRMVLSALLLAPGSFFMGMPFPTMIRTLRQSDERIIPWAWAINAFASVIASVLAVICAIQLGFNALMYIGAGFYLLAAVFFMTRAYSLPLPRTG